MRRPTVSGTGLRPGRNRVNLHQHLPGPADRLAVILRTDVPPFSLPLERADVLRPQFLYGMRLQRVARSDDSDSFIRRMLFPNDITPFYASELSNSYGWTLMFKMRGVDWI